MYSCMYLFMVKTLYICCQSMESSSHTFRYMCGECFVQIFFSTYQLSAQEQLLFDMFGGTFGLRTVIFLLMPNFAVLVHGTPVYSTRLKTSLRNLILSQRVQTAHSYLSFPEEHRSMVQQRLLLQFIKKSSQCYSNWKNMLILILILTCEIFTIFKDIDGNQSCISYQFVSHLLKCT